MKNKGKLLGSTSREKLGGSTSNDKPANVRPKPQFSTDFVDRQKYKLSEAEMIQRKAALQSKHRQQAIEQLQERRKKLEMGIIDEDTRKVYETALTSKNIDLNPPPRKNLSQMIQYERQRQKETNRERPQQHPYQDTKEQEENQAQSGEEYERELKQAQAFIKKFERAKKMDKIERAVNLLTEPESKLPPPSAKPREKSKERPIFENPCINSNMMKQSSTSLNTSTNEEILSNIEDTIRFMEERLFSAGRADKLKKEYKDKEESRVQYAAKNTSYSQLPYKCNQSLSNHQQPIHNRNFEQETLEISHLKVKQSSGEDEEDDCLDTIRRMKEMMDPKEVRMKENYDFGNKIKRQFEELSTVQKPTPHHADSDAEIDFSLTINHSLASDRSRPSTITRNQDQEYQRIKKSLFQEVNRLQMQNQDSTPSPSLFAKTKHYEFIDESSIPLATPSPLPAKKPKKTNPELQKLRSQIDGTKNSVEAIKVEQARQGEVIGMDFRGSFNIKKNVLSHP